MAVERKRANLGNLGEEFLDRDPQQGSGLNTSDNQGSEDGKGEESGYRRMVGAVDDREADNPENVGFAGNYGDDIILGEGDRNGAMDTEFLNPADSQAIYSDEEPGGLYGSTQDQIMGSTGPDGQDLGDTEEDIEHPVRSFGGEEALGTVELLTNRDLLGSTGMEDQLSTDLPPGGTYGDRVEVVDPESGELSDYDDS